MLNYDLRCNLATRAVAYPLRVLKLLLRSVKFYIWLNVVLILGGWLAFYSVLAWDDYRMAKNREWGHIDFSYLSKMSEACQREFDVIITPEILVSAPQSAMEYRLHFWAEVITNRHQYCVWRSRISDGCQTEAKRAYPRFSETPTTLTLFY